MKRNVDIQKTDYKLIKKLYTDPSIRQYLGGPRKEATLIGVLDGILQSDKDCWNWTSIIEN
ncbi:hypothetical protein [Priestia flexa]|uniref:hypothetical protein n=1 Tax=Priestia flexa TaxID=86664 RepID=UPI001B343E60|nr:hypothetical protein [Priestia flexa]